MMWQVMLDNEMILSMLRHVVAGLSFLHSAEPPIIHQELRSLKILLDSSCRAHLTDFQQEVVPPFCCHTLLKICLWLHSRHVKVCSLPSVPLFVVLRRKGKSVFDSFDIRIYCHKLLTLSIGHGWTNVHC